MLHKNESNVAQQQVKCCTKIYKCNTRVVLMLHKNGSNVPQKNGNATQERSKGCTRTQMLHKKMVMLHKNCQKVAQKGSKVAQEQTNVTQKR